MLLVRRGHKAILCKPTDLSVGPQINRCKFAQANLVFALMNIFASVYANQVAQANMFIKAGSTSWVLIYHRDKAAYNIADGYPLLFEIKNKNLPATANNTQIDTTKYVGQVYEEQAGRKTNFIFLGSTRIAAVSNGKVMYYHADHLGGTNVLTDQTGLVRELTEYKPFGGIARHEKYGSDTATAWYYFTGKPLDDETGLMYYGARYYNPSLGRFITPDTIVQSPGTPQTLNRYTYCNNNPVNNIDPTGHSWRKFWKKFGDFISPLGRAIVTGEWKHFGQQVLNIATIAMGVMSGNPYLVASGSLSFFNTATSEFQGGDWGKAHRIIGYTATALAVIGTTIELQKSFNSWNEHNQLMKEYETGLIADRKEALENGIFDTVDFYSRDVPASGNIYNYFNCFVCLWVCYGTNL